MFRQDVDFDAFAGTVGCSEAQIINFLLSKYDLSGTRPLKNKFGYREAIQVCRGETRLADVYWGSDGGDTHIRHEGQGASELRSLLLEFCATHRQSLRPTRIDARVDWIEPGLFDSTARALTKFALDKDLAISQVGDWARGRSRTLYVGSRHSPLMVRLYEKGHQMGSDPDWVRYEVEFKPKKLEQKIAAVSYEPTDVLHLRWSGEFLNSCGWLHELKTPLPSVYKPSDEVRARQHLLKQYGGIIESWAGECGGYENLGKELRRGINQLKDEKVKEYA